MKKIIYILVSIFILLNIINTKLYADDISDHIILGDIAPYQRLTKTIDPLTEELKTIPGYWIYRNAGVLAGTDHFQLDHNDVTYKTKYQSETIDLGIVVQVTQHAGGDSDRWLLHEVEDSYRDDEIGTLGLLTQGARLREINGKKIISLRGNGYSWVSNNVVVDVSYTDLQGTKPEPLEVIQAYLQKFPSTITTTPVEFKGNAYNVKWIKDEIERRLWLCDKWNAQFQSGNVTQADLIYNLVRSMNVFLNYREKYYSVAAAADIAALTGYQQNKDIASIQTKLSEYKGWWSKHKNKAPKL